MNSYFQGLYTGPDPDMGADGIEYDLLAINMIKGNGYAVKIGFPTSFRAPGFPFFLWIIYRFFGAPNYLIARLGFCIIGALTCIFVYIITRDFINERLAMISSLLLAFYPHHAYYSMHFATEPLFTMLLILSILFLGKLCITNKPLFCVLSGVFLGLSTLTKPFLLMFPPFILLWCLYVYKNNWRKGFLYFTIILVSQVIIIIPWTIRNYAIHNSFVPIATNGGSTFWGSNNEIVLNDKEFRGEWISTSYLAGKKEIKSRALSEVDMDKEEFKQGLNFLRDNIHQIPRLLIYKFINFWSPLTKTPNKIFKFVILISYGPLIPFIILGIFKSFFELKPKSKFINFIMLSVILFTVINSLVFWGAPRFRATISPLLLIYASLGFKFVHENRKYIHWQNLRKKS